MHTEYQRTSEKDPSPEKTSNQNQRTGERGRRVWKNIGGQRLKEGKSLGNLLACFVTRQREIGERMLGH